MLKLQGMPFFVFILNFALYLTIPPGVADDVLDDDDDDEATEVQSYFYQSQYYMMIT